MMKIVLASNNSGKIREVNALLQDQPVQIVPQSEFNVPEAVEDGLSFVENALIKARHAARLSGLPAIGEDSGLEVDALQGRPGIYSARFAGEGASDADNNAKLLQELADVPEAQRTARFQSLIVFMRHAEDPVPIICQGTWEGRILTKPRGSNGFGYDPLFWVESEQCSSAELSPEQKNALSHRGQALACLIKKMQSWLSSVK